MEYEMEIRRVTDDGERQRAARWILEALPDWFGIPEAREEYISESRAKIFFCAYRQEQRLAVSVNHFFPLYQPIGFLYLKETGKATVELAVMGVLKEYHRQGIGKELFRQAKAAALALGYSFMQVKTVQMGRYEDYDRTNLFYLSLGFQEFEVFPTLWDECNPCQVYVMAL